MPSSPEPGTILVVEGDKVLGQVLSRVLRRQGLRVTHAVSAAQALELVERHPPQVVLVDCCGREGNDLDLAAELHRRCGGLPVIVAMDEPPPGTAFSLPASQFAHFLAKPMDLDDLRRAVAAALAGPGDKQPGGQGDRVRPRPCPPVSSSVFRELSMPLFLMKFFKAAGLVAFLLIVLAGFAVAMGGGRPPWQPPPGGEPAPLPPKPAALAVELVKGRPHTLMVPEEVRTTLGIRQGKKDLLAVARKPTHLRPLVMPGSTALDPTRLYRIRARFAPSPSSAEVVQIAQVPEDPRQTGKVGTVFREIRSGDRVKKGDLLAVFYSVDVGNMKNNLIDAIYQLELDDQILKKAEAKAEVVPEVFLWNAKRNVVGDINTINRTVSTLRTWGIAEEDIQAVRDEAEKVKQREGKHDKAKDALWARVEMKAPDDGVIIERNVALHEIIVDNTTNLFQIAKVDRLAVFANCPEDDLPALEALPTAQRRWTVRTVGSSPVQGFIDDISYLIDPNQHTAVVKGHIDNPKEILRGGQFISATVELPPPPDVVEVPTDAVVDDGQTCIVFVETDAPKQFYTMRRVQLTHRFAKTVFVRSKPFAKGEQLTSEEAEQGLLPKEPLRPGERILATGVGELKAALLDKESEPNKDQKEDKGK